MDINEGKLVEYLRGSLDKEARETVERWCDESPENKKLMEQVYYTSFLGERATVMQNIDIDKSLNDFKTRIAEKKHKIQADKREARRVYWLKITVVAALFAGILFGVGFMGLKITENLSHDFVVMTKSGERAQAVLPDGTKVWLNAESKVDYHKSFFSSERRVSMNGEVYFEVTKDKHAPFIVNSKNIDTKVLGTKFNIRANAEDEWVTTTLLEGSVLVTASGMKEVHMKPDQQLRVNSSTMKSELNDCTDADESIGWIEGKLHFEQVTLKEIMSTLAKYYKVNIIFADEKLQEQKFTCDFDLSDSIHQILSLLSLTNKFDYQVDDDKDITIVKR